MMEYKRPELEEKEVIRARMDVATLLRKYGLANAPVIIRELALENMRLVKEINEHRAARGFEPLKTFKV